MKIFVGITSCDRPESLSRLLSQLQSAEYAGSNLEVHVLDDRSATRQQMQAWDCFKRPGWAFRSVPRKRGKYDFWRTHNDLMALFLDSDASVYMCLPDDVELSGALFPVVEALFAMGACEVLNLHRDHRVHSSCWGSKPAEVVREVEGVCVDLVRTDWVDGVFVANRRAVRKAHPLNPIKRRWSTYPDLGSGVGEAMSWALRLRRIPIFHATRSLVRHLNLRSQMNPVARRKDPLETLDYLP